VEVRMLEIQLQIVQVEEALRVAMSTSDVAALELLIADDLLFTDHCGRLWSKQDDLEIHCTGMLTFSQLVASELVVRIINEALAVASIRMKVAGAFRGEPFDANLRYTRVWRKGFEDRWQVVVGHSCIIADLTAAVS
jgi:ketosteroid isomerase-like protein